MASPIRINYVTSDGFKISFPQVRGATDYKVSRRRIVPNMPPGVWVDFQKPPMDRSLTVTGLEQGQKYEIRVSARKQNTPNTPYTTLWTTTATPWYSFQDMEMDEQREFFRHTSLFTGGFDTDHVALNNVACLPTQQQYRTRADDKQCGPTAPRYVAGGLPDGTREESCCVGADASDAANGGHELRFLQALDNVYNHTKIDTSKIPPAFDYAVKWVRAHNHRAVTNQVTFSTGDYWHKIFIQFLFLAGFAHTANVRLVFDNTELYSLNSDWSVNASNGDLRLWMSETGLNGHVHMDVNPGNVNTVPYASHAQEISYHVQAGTDVTYYDMTNLPQVLASPNCGFKDASYIDFYGAPSAFPGNFKTFLQKVVAAMVVNNKFSRMEVKFKVPIANFDAPPEDLSVIPDLLDDEAARENLPQQVWDAVSSTPAVARNKTTKGVVYYLWEGSDDLQSQSYFELDVLVHVSYLTITKERHPLSVTEAG